MSRSQSRAFSIFCLVTTTVLWSFPAIAIRYLSDHFDGFTQNMYRYGVSAVFLLLLSFVRRRNIFRIGWRNFLRLLGPTLPNIGFQIIWVSALYIVYPGFAAILVRMWVLLSIVLAVILFPEERSIVKQPRFIIGTILSFCGMLGVMYLREGVVVAQFDLGVVLVLAGALAWATYAIEIKRVVEHVDPSDAFVVVSLLTAVALTILAFVFGSPGKILEVPTHINVVLVVSGLGCIALGHSTYYVAIRGLGVAVCSTCVLVSCFCTLGLSYLLFNEQIAAGQIASGAVLVLGSSLAVWSSRSRS